MQSMQRVKCAAFLVFAALTTSVPACSDITSLSPEQLSPANGARLVVSPQQPGLVAAYGFDEVSGAAVADGSGSNNTGTVVAFRDTVSDTDLDSVFTEISNFL